MDGIDGLAQVADKHGVDTLLVAIAAFVVLAGFSMMVVQNRKANDRLDRLMGPSPKQAIVEAAKENGTRAPGLSVLQAVVDRIERDNNEAHEHLRGDLQSIVYPGIQQNAKDISAIRAACEVRHKKGEPG